MSDLRFYLCLRCRHAWHGTIAPCCGQSALDVNPFHGERRLWYQASTKGREAAIFTAANYRTRDDHRASLARGSVTRGNEWAVGS